MVGTPLQRAETRADERPQLANEADKRTLELETLHALAKRVAVNLLPEKVLRASLDVLIEMNWFRCGEAFLVDSATITTVEVGRCPYEAIEHCPLRPNLLGQVKHAVHSGNVTQHLGWNIVPIEGIAALALAGGEASRPFLEGVASTVAAALERAQLHTRLAEKEQQRADILKALLRTQEEERARISRDLHDQVGQALTGIALGLDALGSEVDASRSRGLKELVSLTLSDVRRIARELRPSVLDELGLEAALERVAQEIAERGKFAVEVLVRLPERLQPEQEIVLYRVTQEALTNILRHAQASNVSVVLMRHKSGGAQLLIEDDGVGFDPKAVPQRRLGISGMRERIELFGGTFRLDSAPGNGTTVRVTMPSTTVRI